MLAAPENITALWVKDLKFLAKQPSLNIAKWIIKPYKLSVALKKITTDFNVWVISQQFAPPFTDEISFCKEGLTGAHTAYVRRINLRDGEKPLTYARVVVPNQTFENNQSALQKLGNKPIGETLLYCHPNYQRSGFEYKYCGPDSALLGESGWKKDGILEAFARRSVFWLNGDPLIISELYHPELPNYPDQVIAGGV